MSPEIAIIVPSRGRPEAFGDLLASWEATTTGRSTIWLALDDDDPTTDGYPVQRVIGSRDSMCGWTNRVAALTANFPWSYPVLASLGDDHRLEGDWEAQVLAAVDQAGGTAIVYGDDGIQGHHLPTACFITADIVRALGWMCLPGLEHLWCDNVWKVLGERAGVLRYLPDLKTPHLHPARGLSPVDATYEQGGMNGDVAARDKATFDAWMAGPVDTDVAKIRALVEAKRGAS